MPENISQFGAFEWDSEKEKFNVAKHRLSFTDAIDAFLDSQRVIAVDEAHSEEETRLFCIGDESTNKGTIHFVFFSQRMEKEAYFDHVTLDLFQREVVHRKKMRLLSHSRAL